MKRFIFFPFIFLLGCSEPSSDIVIQVSYEGKVTIIENDTKIDEIIDLSSKLNECTVEGEKVKVEYTKSYLAQDKKDALEQMLAVNNFMTSCSLDAISVRFHASFAGELIYTVQEALSIIKNSVQHHGESGL